MSAPHESVNHHQTDWISKIITIALKNDSVFIKKQILNCNI